MPEPVSSSEICTKSPVSGKPSSRRSVTLRAPTVKRPPVVIASRALTARLITAAPNFATSTRIGQTPGSIATTSDDFEPSDVFSSSRHVPTHCPTSIVSLCSGCLRATPRSWRVSDCPFFSALDRAEFLVEMLDPAPPRDLHVARDDHQQVVEVVRDAADEIAERLHLARLPVRRFDRAPHRCFGLPAVPRLLFRLQPLERQPDHGPQRNRRREHRDEQHAQVFVPFMPDRRRAVRARHVDGVAADLAIRDDLAARAVVAHAHDAGARIVARVAERDGAIGVRECRRRRIRRDHRAVRARERHRHRRARSAEQVAVERVEIRRLQRDRHHPANEPSLWRRATPVLNTGMFSSLSGPIISREICSMTLPSRMPAKSSRFAIDA